MGMATLKVTFVKHFIVQFYLILQTRLTPIELLYPLFLSTVYSHFRLFGLKGPTLLILDQFVHLLSLIHLAVVRRGRFN